MIGAYVQSVGMQMSEGMQESGCAQRNGSPYTV